MDLLWPSTIAGPSRPQACTHMHDSSFTQAMIAREPRTVLFCCVGGCGVVRLEPLYQQHNAGFRVSASSIHKLWDRRYEAFIVIGCGHSQGAAPAAQHTSNGMPFLCMLGGATMPHSECQSASFLLIVHNTIFRMGSGSCPPGQIMLESFHHGPST